jgi:K+-sensing histidine kinase KdpD
LWSLLRTRALYRKLDRKQRHQGTEINERRRWLSYVLHDLQGAVGALRATFDYLGRFAPPKTDRRRGDFDEALQDGETTFHQLLQSIRTVLDFDRFEAGVLAPSPKPVRLSEIARTLANELKEGVTPQAEVEVVASAEEVAIQLDPALIRGALVNLILHCAKHGTGRTFVMVAGERQELSVRISRAGLRFPDVDKARLFEPYNQLGGRPVGYGVGLALSRAIIQAHGGEIWIEDAPALSGAGAFVFTLPTRSGESRRGNATS